MSNSKSEFKFESHLELKLMIGKILRDFKDAFASRSILRYFWIRKIGAGLFLAWATKYLSIHLFLSFANFYC